MEVIVSWRVDWAKGVQPEKGAVPHRGPTLVFMKTVLVCVFLTFFGWQEPAEDSGPPKDQIPPGSILLDSPWVQRRLPASELARPLSFDYRAKADGDVFLAAWSKELQVEIGVYGQEQSSDAAATKEEGRIAHSEKGRAASLASGCSWQVQAGVLYQIRVKVDRGGAGTLRLYLREIPTSEAGKREFQELQKVWRGIRDRLGQEEISEIEAVFAPLSHWFKNYPESFRLAYRSWAEEGLLYGQAYQAFEVIEQILAWIGVYRTRNLPPRHPELLEIHALEAVAWWRKRQPERDRACQRLEWVDQQYLSEGMEDSPYRAKVLLNLVNLLCEERDYLRALSMAEEMHQNFRSKKASLRILWAYLQASRGLALSFFGRDLEARKALEEAWAIFETEPRLPFHNRAELLNNLASNAISLSDRERARFYLEKAMDLCRQNHLPEEEWPFALQSNRGSYFLLMEMTAEGEAFCLQLMQSKNWDVWTVNNRLETVRNLAKFRMARGNVQGALEAIRQASEEIVQEAEIGEYRLHLIEDESRILAEAGRLEEGLSKIEAFLREESDVDRYPPASLCRLKLLQAFLQKRAGRFSQAGDTGWAAISDYLRELPVVVAASTPREAEGLWARLLHRSIWLQISLALDSDQEGADLAKHRAFQLAVLEREMPLLTQKSWNQALDDYSMQASKETEAASLIASRNPDSGSGIGRRMDERIFYREQMLRSGAYSVNFPKPELSWPIDFQKTSNLSLILFRTVPENQQPVSEPKLVAFVAESTGELALVDLGPAEPIRTAVEHYPSFLPGNAAIRDRGIGGRRREFKAPVDRASEFQQAGTRLAELVFDPISDGLPAGAELGFLANDFLGAVPWDTLPVTGGFLGDRNPVRQFLTLNGIPRQVSSDLEPGEMLLVGVSNYGSSRREEGKQEAEVGKAAERSFPSIPFALEEVEQIQKQMQRAGVKVRKLKEGQIQPADFFQQAESTAWLHLAQHAYLDPQAAELYRSAKTPTAVLGLDPIHRPLRLAPMAFTALVFAGANQASLENSDRSFLHGNDLLWMNLQHCQMVVLSACHGSAGIPKLMGAAASLQNAFHFAGAQRVLANLWPVGDQEAKRFMEAYYRFLQESDWRPALALHQSKQAFRRQGEPLSFWGGWQLTELAPGLDRVSLAPIPTEVPD